MPTKKDYYEILNITRTASDKEIKAAYRKLARKHHPDVNQGDPDAETRFKEIAEAFAVLSDPEKRAKYDRGGHDAFGPGFDPFAGTGFDFRNFGFGDISDLFGIFGGAAGGAPGRGRGPSRGEDIQFQINISFEQAVKGATLEIRLSRQGMCGSCGGMGVTKGSGQVSCAECGGTGRIAQRRGGLQVALTCRRCGGAGRLPGTPCDPCNGTGRRGTEEKVKVRIPAGIENGGKVRLKGKGNAGESGGPPGDAFLVVSVDSHPVFTRHGRDLYCDVPVSLARAALGGTIRVPTLHGSTSVTLPAGTASGKKLRLRGEGVAAGRSSGAGDLYAVIQIHPPANLDSRSRELLEEFDRLNPGD